MQEFDEKNYNYPGSGTHISHYEPKKTSQFENFLELLTKHNLTW